MALNLALSALQRGAWHAAHACAVLHCQHAGASLPPPPPPPAATPTPLYAACRPGPLLHPGSLPASLRVDAGALQPHQLVGMDLL
jgi:hypothetical protein